MDKEEEKGIQRWLSSGELLGVGQTWRPTDSCRELTLHIRELFNRNQQLEVLVASQWESARLFQSEATQLRSALAKEVKRVAELKARVVKLETELSQKPEPPPHTLVLLHQSDR